VLGRVGERLGDHVVGGYLDRFGEPAVDPDVEVDGDDLDPGYYASRANSTRKVRNHVRELQARGYTVTQRPDLPARLAPPSLCRGAGLPPAR
jgi:hypothetical protein